MRKLDDWDKEMIRRAPNKGSVYRLAALFHRTPRLIKYIRNGTSGMPLLNGLGARPWEITERDLIEKWRTRQLARIEAAYQRALTCVDNDEAISIKIEPTRDEALSLMPGEPGSLVLFRGALTCKPRSPPPATPAAPRLPATAKSQPQPGVFYDRR